MNPLLRYAATIALAAYFMLQARKPSKWFGRLFVQALNQGHSSMTDWGFTHVVIENHFTILDVGCGGGRTVEKLAAIATAGMVSRTIMPTAALLLLGAQWAADQGRSRGHRKGLGLSVAVP